LSEHDYLSCEQKGAGWIRNSSEWLSAFGHTQSSCLPVPLRAPLLFLSIVVLDLHLLRVWEKLCSDRDDQTAYDADQCEMQSSWNVSVDLRRNPLRNGLCNRINCDRKAHDDIHVCRRNYGLDADTDKVSDSPEQRDRHHQVPPVDDHVDGSEENTESVVGDSPCEHRRDTRECVR